MQKKKYLENPFWAPFIVPLAILLVASLIIFGVSKILSTQKTYHDLVRDLESKTFGNRWVAAFELSKELVGSRIAKEDYPWLVESLSRIYKTSLDDQRTRHFIITALGNLKTPLVAEILEMALSDVDDQVRFSAVVALGNAENGIPVHWEKLRSMLRGEDAGVKQAVIWTLLKHAPQYLSDDLPPLLNDSVLTVRYSAAIGLIFFQKKEALPYLKEILQLRKNSNQLHFQQVEQLKYNLLAAAEKYNWPELNREISTWVKESVGEDLSLIGKAREILQRDSLGK